MEIITIVAYVSGALGVLFGGIAWMIHVQISPVKQSLTDVKESLDKHEKNITALLTNHITDTNRKIDKLSDRIDDLSGRFDRLYELLLKDKIENK